MTPMRAARPVVIAAALLGLAGCEVNLNTDGLSVKDTRTFAVSGIPDVSVDTFDGSVEVHSWDRQEVEVEIEKRAMDQALLGQIVVEAEQRGDRVGIRVTGPSPAASGGVTIGVHISPAARLRVAMPRRATLHARTGDGAIRVEDIEGRITLRTRDGSVTAERLSGEVEVRTDDGAIRIAKAEGRLDLETGDGSITVDGRPLALRADTGDGAIRVRVEDGVSPADAWTLSTRDGSITLTLPEVFAAEIDAETRDGAIRSTHPALAVDTGRRDRVQAVRQRMGGGGPTVKIRTGDGSIRIER